MEMYRCANCMQEMEGEEQVCPHCGFVSEQYPQPANALKINTILYGRYLIGKVLGQGGFGITYVGYDLKLELKVAVKEYFPSGMASRDGACSNQLQWSFTGVQRQSWSEGLERFLREARKMAKLDSVPGIIRVRDSFQENQTAYIVMDFAEGVTLKQYIGQHGKMDEKTCVRMFLPLMDSLAVMHEKGLIHRDISPANIMVEQTSGAMKVRLLDFGAAVDMGAAHSGASQAVVTRGYSAPEQYTRNGKIGSWTDVYSLAAVMYNCISETQLPEAPSRLMTPTAFSIKGIKDKKLGEALKKALALKAEERIQTMPELKKILSSGRGLFSGKVAAVAAVCVAAVAAVGIFIATQGSGTVEAVRLGHANGTGDALFYLDKGNYGYYVDAAYHLYVTPYNEEDGTFVPSDGSSDLADENGYCINAGADYMYFIHRGESGDAIVQMTFDGSQQETLLDENNYTGLQYVQDSEGKESLYYMKENGNKADLLWTLCRYDLERKEEEALLSEDICWYNIQGKYVYFSTLPTGEPTEKIVLKRAFLNGQKSEVLDEEHDFLNGVVDNEEALLFSYSEKRPYLCDLEGNVKEDVPEQYLREIGDSAMAFAGGWIYYSPAESGILYKIRTDGENQTVIYEGDDVKEIGYSGATLLLLVGRGETPDHAFVLSSDGSGMLTAAGEYQREDGLLYRIEDEKVILTGYLGNKDYVIVPWNLSDYWWVGHTADSFPDHVICYGYPREDELRYEKTEDETGVILTGYEGDWTANWPWLAIPAKLDGLPVTELGEELFKDNKVLEGVRLPDSIEKIGKNAFRFCKSLKKINLPEGLKTIDVFALADTGLEEIMIPSSVESVGYGALRGIEKMDVADGNPYFSMRDNMLWYNTDNAIVMVPPSFSGAYTVPGDAKKVYSWAFSFTNIEDVILPGSIENLFSNAFYKADKLQKVVISEGTQKIGSSCFLGCTALKTAEIPASVKIIESEAFKDCPNLREVTISRDCEVQEGAFDDGVKISYYE